MQFTMLNSPVPAAARVLDLLELLAGSERGATLSAAAAGLRIAKSSTLMLLRTLVARGYVVRTEEDTYVLNEAFRRHGFGWGGSRFARLIAVARPVMRALCQALGETVLLGSLDDDGRVRILAKVVSVQDIRYDIDITTRVPAYCTAMGRVLLAGGSRTRRDEILKSTPRRRLTPETIVNLARLQRLVEQAGVLGYAISQEEYAVGGTGVAVPVLDGDGNAVAALTVGCITSRFRAKREEVIAKLKEAAASLSRLYPQAALTVGDRR